MKCTHMYNRYYMDKYIHVSADGHVYVCRWTYMQMDMYARWTCDMYADGHVCRWTCMQMDTYADGHVCRWTCMQMDMYADGHVCRWTCMQMDMYADGHVCRWTFKLTTRLHSTCKKHTHIHVDVYTYTYKHTEHTCMCVYNHTQPKHSERHGSKRIHKTP